MSDGIVKGVGEQLGKLGKQVATDVVKLPGQLSGLSNDGGTNEAVGQGVSGGNSQQPQQQKPNSDVAIKIESLKQADEIETQKNIAQARRFLNQFKNLNEEDIPIQKKLELEEMEKKKKEIEEEQTKAKKILQPMSMKPKKGNLVSIKSKQFGSEVGKNVKSQ